MLLEPEVGVHPDPQPPGRFPVKLDKAVPHSYFRCQLRTQVLLVASSTGEECGFGLCGVKLQLPSFCPVDAHSGTGLELSDDLVDVVPRRHPSKVVHEGQVFGSGDPFLITFYQPWLVDCKEDRRHRWALWYTCFHRVSLHNVALKYHFDCPVCEKTCRPSDEVSIHPLASHSVDQSPPPYAREGCLDVHQEYARYVALSQGCVCSVNHDCRCVDCRPPFSAPIMAVAKQSSSLSLISQQLCNHFFDDFPHAAQ